MMDAAHGPETRAGEAPPLPPAAPDQLSAPVLMSVRHECDVAGVIGATLRLCTAHRLGTVFAAHVATAASELANNLWMHASHGGLLRLSLVASDGRHGVELQAEDDGPGIPDIAQALSEGFSTGGGMGCGLPGVQRLMDEFEIVSHVGSGTRVRARKWLPRPR